MSDESQTSLLEGVTYRDNLPIDWEVVSALPGEGEQHRLNHSNEDLLQTLLILDEPYQDTEDEGEGPGHGHLRHLEAKLDLVLSLVGEMLAAAVVLPKPHPMQIGAQGLCLTTGGEGIVQVGNLLKMKLYLDSKIPRPLQLYAHVRAVDEGGFTLEYIPLEPVLQDLLDKYVFRQHRRAIASSRHTQKTQ
jgi:hypothetical protein